MYVKANLFQPATLVHGFFGRKGGVSTGLYSSLNCALKPGESEANVKTNQTIICDSLGLELTQLNLLDQVHSNRVHHPITLSRTVQADAMVTNTPGIALGIQTADCTPILLADQTHGVIGAIHSGWRGAFAGVIGNTVAEMQKLGAKLEDIACAIGPTIQQDTYEVDDVFYNAFIEKSAANRKFFKESTRSNHYMFNLPGYCIADLQNSGVDNIENLEINTYTHPQDYFSCRRSTHEGIGWGVQMAVISLL